MPFDTFPENIPKTEAGKGSASHIEAAFSDIENNQGDVKDETNGVIRELQQDLYVATDPATIQKYYEFIAASGTLASSRLITLLESSVGSYWQSVHGYSDNPEAAQALKNIAMLCDSIAADPNSSYALATQAEAFSDYAKAGSVEWDGHSGFQQREYLPFKIAPRRYALLKEYQGRYEIIISDVLNRHKLRLLFSRVNL